MRGGANIRDLTGRVFDRLTVVRQDGRMGRSVAWLCQCTCGQSKRISSARLGPTRSVRSCGCLRRELARTRNANGPWNTGARYHIEGGEHVYSSRQAWSKAVIKHYGNRCEECGWAEARCDAHHRTPRAQGGRNTIANGVVVCPNHHRIRHEQLEAASNAEG